MKELPINGTICYCVTCGEMFRAWPNVPFCIWHREDWYEY